MIDFKINAFRIWMNLKNPNKIFTEENIVSYLASELEDIAKKYHESLDVLEWSDE